MFLAEGLLADDGLSWRKQPDRATAETSKDKFLAEVPLEVRDGLSALLEVGRSSLGVTADVYSARGVAGNEASLLLEGEGALLVSDANGRQLVYGSKLPALSSLSRRIALDRLLSAQLTLLVTDQVHRCVPHVLVEVINFTLQGVSNDCPFILDVPDFQSRQHGCTRQTLAIG